MPHSTNYQKPLTVKEELTQLREQFIRDRVIFLEGRRMISLLKKLGATAEDFEDIQKVSDGLPLDPTLPFRRSKNCRFVYDFKKDELRRLEFQPFMLSAEEDFVRHDSGTERIFEEVDNDLQLNSVLQALFIFKAFMFRDTPFKHRPKLDYSTNDFICTLFNLRTVTTPDLVGEPALEGVHSDGVDFTMTTYLGSQNMTDSSAITFVHDNKEQNAISWDKTDPKYLLAVHQHRNFLDTLLFFDHEMKHSLSPVQALDQTNSTTRDMLIFFTRKPVMSTHSSFKYDSLKDHKRKPASVDLRVN